MKFKYKKIGTGLGFGSNLLTNILKDRGIENPHKFLNVNSSDTESYMLFDNIMEGVHCLDKHLKADSHIFILVDSDADGLTSASVMYNYLKMIKPNVKITYGMHIGKAHSLTKTIMSQIMSESYSLIIIPDASSNDTEQCKLLKEAGRDVIVLDHHEISKANPYGIVINNQLSDRVTNKTLTGVGVAYKFCQALDDFYKVKYADNLLDLVAIGQIADSSDLRNLESRYFVLKGLELIETSQNKNKFVSAIIKKQAYSMKNKVTIMGVAFYIAPLLNAVIRSGTVDENTALFQAFIGEGENVVTKIRGKGETELNVEEYAVRVCEACKRRQDKIVKEAVDVLLEQIEHYNLNQYAILVVNSQGLSANYTGLVANKLASTYQKPCLLLRNDDSGFFRGSGRGYEKKGIDNLREWCNDTKLFEYAQGHNQAMGVSIEPNNIDKLYDVISKLPNKDVLFYDVDAVLNDKTLNKNLIEQIAKYDYIWGNGVKEPLFALENIIIDGDNIRNIGSTKNTIKLSYKGIDIIKFGTNEEEYNRIVCNKNVKFTIIGRFSVNEYNGTKTPQVIVDEWNYEKTNATRGFVF